MDIVLVGCGNMGFAMLSGWVKAEDALRFHVVDPSEAYRDRAAGVGASVYAAAEDLPVDLAPSLIILAVKPQMMPEVAPAYARFENATALSIAAGITIDGLSNWLSGMAVIRSMPNTPAAIGQGMVVSVSGPGVAREIEGLAERLLSAVGRHAWVEDEALIDAVTAISGSGPAYVFHLIECMADAARELGLPDELAETMALQTVAGAGALAAGADETPSRLREMVTSPKGTTEAALGVLMGRLGPLVEEAATAARDRGRALGKKE